MGRGRRTSGPFDDRWPSTARTSAAPPSLGSAVGSRVREPGPSPVAQTRPGITPSPPDVVPQNVRRAARAPGAGAHPERRHAHARSGGSVAAARTPEGPIARLVMLAGTIWRDRSAKTTVVHPDEDPGDHRSGARRDSHRLSTTCPGITARTGPRSRAPCSTARGSNGSRSVSTPSASPTTTWLTPRR